MIPINLRLMQKLLQLDLGSSLLSVAIILGWLGLFFCILENINNFNKKNPWVVIKKIMVIKIDYLIKKFHIIIITVGIIT